MSLTEWILGSAVVLLWLSLWAQSHRLTLLREELTYHMKDPCRHFGVEEIHFNSNLWELLWKSIHAKQDKPLLRRATDKVPWSPVIGKKFDWMFADEPPMRAATHRARKKKKAKK